MTASTSSESTAPNPVSKGVWLVTLALALAVGIAGYAWKGRWDLATGSTQAASEATANPSPQDVDALLARLAERMQAQPDDAQGWRLLANAYLSLGRLEEAERASLRALKLTPDDASTLVDHADILAMKQGRNLAGEPMQFVERALKLDPQNLKGMALAGAAAFEAGDMARAAQWWDRVATTGPAGSPLVTQAQEGADEARRIAQQQGAPVARAEPAKPAGQSAPKTSPASVKGTLTLSPKLAAQVKPEDTVFVYARPASSQGRGMPLAILRHQVKDLPLSFTLDDSLAMGGGAGISSANSLLISARISRSGQAMPQPGDLEGSLSDVALGSTGLMLTIDRVRP